MTESESVALPLGDAAFVIHNVYYNRLWGVCQALFLKKFFFFYFFPFAKFFSLSFYAQTIKNYYKKQKNVNKFEENITFVLLFSYFYDIMYLTVT